MRHCRHLTLKQRTTYVPHPQRAHGAACKSPLKFSKNINLNEPICTWPLSNISARRRFFFYVSLTQQFVVQRPLVAAGELAGADALHFNSIFNLLEIVLLQIIVCMCKYRKYVYTYQHILTYL